MISFRKLADNGEETACFRVDYNPGKGTEEDHENLQSEYRRLVCVRIIVAGLPKFHVKLGDISKN
jgi:hypothetical protein